MSHHLHSVSTEEYGIVNVDMGYDPSLHHIFCIVKQESNDTPLYTSLEDDQGGAHQQDVEYFRGILDLLGLSVPESMFVELQLDQTHFALAHASWFTINPDGC